MNIAQHFFDSARLYPANVAIVHKDTSITYSELEKQVEETANYFLSKGISKGDRVLVFVPMSIDLYRIVLALFSIGATAVFLDEWVSKKRMELCCSIAQCKGFIGITKAVVLRWFSAELRQIPIRLKISGRIMHEKFVPKNCSEKDTALITFTTGSTGTPKAAKRTHYFLEAQFRAIQNKIHPEPTDVDLPMLPIVLLINLGVGATSVIYNYKPSKPKSLHCDQVAELIKIHKVSRIISSPYFMIELGKYVISSREKLVSLKKLCTGGAPVFPNEAQLLCDAFQESQIEIVYGSTEAEPISAITAGELKEKNEQALTIGLPVGYPDSSAEVKIIAVSDENIEIDSENELDELQVNSVGEIIVSGDHVLKEYFNNQEALNRNKIFIGEKVFHRTGDSGFLDKDGNLYLTGRCASLINVSDQIIHPFLEEYFLCSLDDVIIGSILKMGEQFIIAIEISSNADRPKLVEQIKSRYSFHVQIRFMKIPRDPRHYSKIDYETLKYRLFNN